MHIETMTFYLMKEVYVTRLCEAENKHLLRLSRVSKESHLTPITRGLRYLRNMGLTKAGKLVRRKAQFHNLIMD